MPIMSNLYAEKVFSEQPLALWALDDNIKFASIFPQDASNTSAWTTSNVTSMSISSSENTDAPIQESYTMEIVGATPSSNTKTLRISYDSVANFTDLNQDIDTISLGFYLYAPGIDITNLSLGITYDNSNNQTQTLSETVSFVDNGWGFVSSTIDLPDADTAFDAFISITYASGAGDYTFFINGMSLGQWSENHQPTNPGTVTELLPEDIYSAGQTHGVSSYAYGLQSSKAFYVGTEKQVFARNTGVPLVFGSNSSTRVYKNPDGPSLIMSGFGFMNDSGKYRENTVEFWLRAEPHENTPRRIFGPIGLMSDSSDCDYGLYLNGEFLTLKVGDQSSSYFVSSWSRPMLIQIRMSEKQASLLLNGEQVIDMDINTSSIEFPKKYKNSKNQDMLGFFAYDDTSVLEIDCVGIYPYRVQPVVAKRRFVYGQGVSFPENLNASYGGQSAFVDYSFANYSNNYNYPDIGDWGQGASDNVLVTKNSISAPSYSLPTIRLSDQETTYASWLLANSEDNASSNEGRKFFKILPSGISATDGYMLIERLNSIGQDVEAIYGVFKPTEVSESEQVLIQINDDLTGNYFAITITENVIKYLFKYGNTAPQLIYSANTIVPDIAFSVGFNIKNISNAYGSKVKTFFGQKNRLSVYIGGKKDFSNTFTGKIFNVGISTARNAKKISSFFNQYGIAEIPTDITDTFMLYFDSSEDGQIDFTTVGGYIDPISGSWANFEGTLDGGYYDSFVFGRFQDHVASYTVVAIDSVGELALDIATDSYWEDYVPLSYFAKYVSDRNGDRFYELDFIQANISNPAMINGTSNNIVRSYISFQYLANGSNTLDEYYPYRELPPADHVIVPGSSWLQTKYEFVSGDVIKLPNTADFKNLSIGIHIEMINDASLTKPVKISSLQLASQSLETTVANKVGTKFGVPLFPYRRSGVYYNYKDVVPYSIYKGDTPYLYMTKDSGIRLNDSSGFTGMSVPLNSSLSSDYAIGAIQLAIQYQDGLFPETPTQIFEVESSNIYAKFYLVAGNSARTIGKIYGINQNTNSPVSGLAYYVNGNITKDLYIEQNAWSIIGIQFADALRFESESGAIRITGPLLFNNISYYQIPSTQTALSVVFRRWNQLSDLASYWDDLNTPTQLLWQNVLYISAERSYSIDPSVIFNEYCGTNRISAPAGKQLAFNGYKYSIYKDVKWQSTVVSPV